MGEVPIYLRKSNKKFYLPPTIVGPSGEITTYPGYPKHWRVNFLIIDEDNPDVEPNGNVGKVSLGILENYRPLRLIDIEIDPKFRKQGYAERILNMLLSVAPDQTLIINDIEEEAKPFWEYMGAEYFTDSHEDKNMISAKLTF
tara:strand:- start:119 stop:547 length:429 start_codon:yes stop_codon:yes gene_type:complete